MFGLASAAAAYAGGVDQLIAGRAVMGAGAAFIMPATLSLLISVFTDARERAMAIGIWAATAGIGVALGPVVGGLLLDRFWWGSIFIVNVPLCVLAIVVGRRVVPESRDPVARRIDWTGAALSGAGLIAFVWAVIEAPSRGWTSAPVVVAGAFAVVALTAFVAQQRRAAAPLLDLRLFENPRFTAASGIITVLFFALFGFLFLSTQYLQFVLGYSPSAAGVRVLPYAAAMIVFAPLSSRLVLRFGTKRVTTTGMLLFSTGLAVAATVTAGTGYGRLAVALVLMGAGMGLAGAPATESIMGSLPPERANIGSAVNDTTRELGGALGVAIVGSIMSSLYSTQLAKGLAEDVPGPVAAAARESLGAAVQINAAVADPAREAFVHAMSAGRSSPRSRRRSAPSSPGATCRPAAAPRPTAHPMRTVSADRCRPAPSSSSPAAETVSAMQPRGGGPTATPGHDAKRLRAGRRVREAVADPVVGANEGFGVRRLDLAAQVGDVRAQALRVPDVPRAPDLLHQHVLGEQPPAMTQQEAQELELDGCEVDVLAVATHRARGEVDDQAIELDTRLVVGSLGPSQSGSQAGDELARRERLGHVVVRAGVQRAHLLLLGVDRAEHDHRDRAPLAQSPAHLDAVAVGQDQLDDRGIGWAKSRPVERFLDGAGRVHGEARVAQDHTQSAHASRVGVAHQHRGRTRAARTRADGLRDHAKVAHSTPDRHTSRP